MSEENKNQDPPPPSLSPPPPAPKQPEIKQEAAPSESVKVTSRPDDEEVVDSKEAGELASLNDRLIGGLIDGIVGAALVYLVTWLPIGFLDRFAWLLSAAYWVTRDSLPFLKGQSIGKMAMKTKVVKLDGTEMIGDWQTAITRNAALLVPFFGGLVEAIVLISRDSKAERGRRLGDEWAKTKVVNAPQPEVTQV